MADFSDSAVGQVTLLPAEQSGKAWCAVFAAFHPVSATLLTLSGFTQSAAVFSADVAFPQPSGSADEWETQRQLLAQDADSWRVSAVICVDLLQEVTVTHRCHDYLIHSAVILQLTILAILTRYTGRVAKTGVTPTPVIFKNIKLFLEKWLTGFKYENVQSEYKRMMEECLQASCEVCDEEQQNHLKHKFSSHVKESIEKLPPLQKLSACLELIGGQSLLGEIVASDVHAYLEDALLCTEAGIARDWFFTSETTAYMAVLRDKMSEFFKTKWNELYTKPNGALEVVFNWRPMLIFMSTLHWNHNFRTYLADKVADYVEKSHTVLEHTKEKVCNGRVKISELNWLLQHRENFCEVVHLMFGDCKRSCSALKLREKELTAFQCLSQEVNCTMTFCQTFIQTGRVCFPLL
ncbi:uncharacterized protein [Littorina saxatilis]|uniref:uncharacterized protein n=1 Tax=Littorina saxatilis TaxID=31220 RepID=UPI0038B4236A